jgi:site-specific DNA-methyltransferase (adenine-specific)
MSSYQVICGDCREQVKKLIDDGIKIDLTITSPPYSDLRKYIGNVNFTDSVWEELIPLLYEITNDGGVVVWIVNDRVKNGSKTGISFRQALAFIDAGFNLNDTMIWKKKNPMPEVKQPRYSSSFEYMFVFSKGKPKTFNPIKVPCKCAGQNYDSTCKNMGGENGRTEKHFVINKEKVKSNVWECAIAQNRTNHTAIFPLQLIVDHVKSWTNEGDMVLDPFVGSGTSGIAALQLNRNFIGIDIVPEYCQLADKQIKDFQHGKSK